MNDYKDRIAHYFGREVSRIKELSTGQIHCAFADGTMSVYSKRQIAQFAEEIMESLLNDSKIKELGNKLWEDEMIFGHSAFHVPSFERIDPISDTMRELLFKTNYLTD